MANNPVDFKGATVVCVASGPSLTDEQLSIPYKLGLPCIVTNNTWERVPFAKILYAADTGWWQDNHARIKSDAARWTCSQYAAKTYNLNLFRASLGGFNSGLRAIQLAAKLGAARVLLLGYDCHIQNGTHWHGDHEKLSNPTAALCKEWQKYYRRESIKIGAQVINCTPGSALDCFPKQPIEMAVHAPTQSLHRKA